MTATYRWVINRDHMAEPGTQEGTNENAKGIVGPRDPYQGADEMAHFSMWDDDGDCIYSGQIYGEYDGFEPLDDYGTPNFGCTGIKLDGDWV